MMKREVMREDPRMRMRKDMVRKTSPNWNCSLNFELCYENSKIWEVKALILQLRRLNPTFAREADPLL